MISLKKISVLVLIWFLSGLYVLTMAEGSTLSMELNDYSFDLKIGLAPDTESAGVYDSSNITGTPADRIRKETEMKLLGAGDRYWFVEYEGKKGYVAKVRVVVEGVATGHDPVGNMVSSSLGMSVTMVRPKDEQYIVLEGTAELTQSVDYIAFFLWDEWQRTHRGSSTD